MMLGQIYQKKHTQMRLNEKMKHFNGFLDKICILKMVYYCLIIINIIHSRILDASLKLTAMFKNLTFFLLIFLILGCKNEKKSFVETNISHHNSENAEENFGIVIHGGAGTILKENMGDSLETAY